MLYFNIRLFIARLPERIWWWIAFHLPFALVKFASIRLIAHATTGQYGNTEPDKLSVMEALNRWHKPKPKSKIRLFALLLIVGGLLLLAAPALAQDVPPPLNRDELPTWEDFILNAAAVFATLGILFGPLSEILVSVVKVVLSKVRPTALKYTGVIAFLLPLVIAALYWTVDAFGFGDAFVRAGNFLLAIAPVILGFFGIQVFQTLTYRGMKRIGASVTGEDKAALKAKG